MKKVHRVLYLNVNPLFESHPSVLCGIKSRNVQQTTNREWVTCKRCLKKMKERREPKMEKIEMLYRDDIGARESHKDLIGKINELIAVVNSQQITIEVLLSVMVKHVPSK